MIFDDYRTEWMHKVKWLTFVAITLSSGPLSRHKGPVLRPLCNKLPAALFSKIQRFDSGGKSNPAARSCITHCHRFTYDRYAHITITQSARIVKFDISSLVIYATGQTNTHCPEYLEERPATCPARVRWQITRHARELGGPD